MVIGYDVVTTCIIVWAWKKDTHIIKEWDPFKYGVSVGYSEWEGPQTQRDKEKNILICVLFL